jgi:hypothetical protein
MELYYIGVDNTFAILEHGNWPGEIPQLFTVGLTITASLDLRKKILFHSIFHTLKLRNQICLMRMS